MPPPEKPGPPYTTSLDASIPGEQIISVNYDDRTTKWTAIQRNPDNSLHKGVGNTEPLARRVAALKGLHFARSQKSQRCSTSQARNSQYYLAQKDALRGIIYKQRLIIDDLLITLNGRDAALIERPHRMVAEDHVISTVLMMIQGIGVSCDSIYRLSGGTDMTIRDCFSIARSIVENSINVAFIMASGKPAAERARRHALQKYYRDLDRRIKIDDFVFLIEYAESFDERQIPELPYALAEFTTKRGHEIRDWTPENLDKKINVITAKYKQSVGRGLACSFVLVYRHSSEIIHGTYFGTQFFWQPSLVIETARSKEIMIRYLFDHFVAISSSVYFAVDALCAIFDAEYGLPRIRKKQAMLLEEYRNLNCMGEEHAPSPAQE